MGSKKSRKIQIGAESTPGQGVPATAILRLNGTIEDETEVIFSEEDVGYLGGTDKSYVAKKGGAITLEGEATFQQLPYILAMCVKNVVTGQVDGTGSDYIYDYPLPTTTVNTVKTYTLEAGDSQAVEEMPFTFVPEFTLQGASGEAVKVSASAQGGEVETSDFTGSLTLSTDEVILFQKAKLYIDAVTGSLGTTPVEGTLLGFTLTVKGGKNRRWTGDGDLQHDHLGQGVPEVTLEVTFEHDSNATGQKSAWRGETPKQVRLIIEGSQFATPGTEYTYHTLQIDLAGKWSSFGALDEDEGNNIVSGTFVAKYNSTAALFADIVVVNEVSALD